MLVQRISVFDMLKIGVGPSSSHTIGPWRASMRFIRELPHPPEAVKSITVELFGSLAKTGKGHGTGMAVMMGLSAQDPVTCDTQAIPTLTASIRAEKTIKLGGVHTIAFDPAVDIVYHFNQTLPFHPNGLRLTATFNDSDPVSAEYYSIGGGFVVKEGENQSIQDVTLPYPCNTPADLLKHCAANDFKIWQMVWENEQQWRSPDAVHSGLLQIWHTMADCIYHGCHTTGELPGGLNVRRRASELHRNLIGKATYNNRDEWIAVIQSRRYNFQELIKWVSCFAIAVNEENAAFGRVVTAPTNGAAGVIPAVLMHLVCFYNIDEDAILRFLMVAGEVGTFFKKGATISAAQGGCQAEIGVSSSMAAAALTESLGGSVAQSLMAAEIAMEHHLGMTCDPIGGLVQIPCIERNAMGAMKAITAANLALESDAQYAKISLDTVIQVMWETARDMSEKYKETSEGGLSQQISVNVIEC